MSSFYVDETSGSDTAGKGTQNQPYQSLAYALFTHGQDAKLLVPKDGAWEEPSQSALKKAKKGADGLEKKRKKAEELAARDAEAKAKEGEKREKLIEESKKICRQAEEDAVKMTPALFREFADADESEKADLVVCALRWIYQH